MGNYLDFGMVMVIYPLIGKLGELSLPPFFFINIINIYNN